MYIPAHFEETRLDVMAALFRRYPLATLVTVGEAGLTANHVPLLYDADPAPYGTLRGHLAKANTQWRDFRAEFGALAVFQGPQAYVSPSFYPSKHEHGRVVPTWNYITVHVRAKLIVRDDPAWIRNQVTELTNSREAAFSAPWQVSDAPSGYIDGLLNAIVGIELCITSLEGKWKVSQNRPAADRDGVAEHLESTDPEMARRIRMAD